MLQKKSRKEKAKILAAMGDRVAELDKYVDKVENIYNSLHHLQNLSCEDIELLYVHAMRDLGTLMAKWPKKSGTYEMLDDIQDTLSGLHGNVCNACDKAEPLDTTHHKTYLWDAIIIPLCEIHDELSGRYGV